MRTKLLAYASLLILIGLSAAAIGVETADTISHTDPSGDVDNEGYTDSTPNNVDIISIEIDTSSDPVVVTLEVVGVIVMDASSQDMYTYNILMDQTGDGSEDSSITVAQDMAMMYSAFTETSNMSPNVTGSGTSTMTITFSRADMGIDSHPVYDIYATAMVANQMGMSAATDEVNENFGDNGSGDDDDDDDNGTTDPDDVDDDGMPDDWEGEHGLDNTTDDSMGDLDGDGYTNMEEYSWGTAPDDPDDHPDYSSDDDDDDDWEWGDDDKMDDPLKEEPTDTSISVEIEDISFSLDKGDEMFEMEQKANGKTSGEVDHCSMTIVSYYDDGSYDAEEWTVGPEIQDRESFFGVTFEMYFKGTGPEGEDDWSQWEMYSYAKAALSMLDDMISDGDDTGDNDTEDKKMTEAYFVVRAYSDEDETNWNQDSEDIYNMYEKFMAGEDFSASLGDSSDDDGGLLPAPGLAIFLTTVSIVALAGIVFGYRKRN